MPEPPEPEERDRDPHEGHPAPVRPEGPDDAADGPLRDRAAVLEERHGHGGHRGEAGRRRNEAAGLSRRAGGRLDERKRPRIDRGQGPQGKPEVARQFGLGPAIRALTRMSPERGELPWLGLIKLSLSGKRNENNPPSTWLKVGSAYAPKDLWVMLAVSLFVYACFTFTTVSTHRQRFQ